MSAVTRLIRIKAQPHVPGGRFCRAGRCFGTVPTELAEGDLTPEQLAALQAEPMLVVEIAEVLEPTGPQAKAEAKAKADADAQAQAPATPAADASAKPAAPVSAPKAAPKADAKPGKPAAKPGNAEGGK